ncbi:MAG: integrase core domain-containing protein [Betaproteobacteria bacterium]
MHELDVPVSIIVGHLGEFKFKAFGEWACQRGIKLDFVRPGRPNESAQIESLNYRLRDECLSVILLTSLDDARRKSEALRQDCDHTRPCGSLWNLTSHEFPQQGQQKWISEVGSLSP